MLKTQIPNKTTVLLGICVFYKKKVTVTPSSKIQQYN